MAIPPRLRLTLNAGFSVDYKKKGIPAEGPSLAGNEMSKAADV